MSPAGSLCGRHCTQHIMSIISFYVLIYPNNPVSVSWVKKQKYKVFKYISQLVILSMGTFNIVSIQYPTLQDGPDELATETFVDGESQRTFWKMLS